MSLQRTITAMTRQMEQHEKKLISLDQLKPGDRGIIRRYQERNDVNQRLLELGLVRGVQVEVKRLAPFGDPMELVVRGYRLSIRKKDASHILVDKS